MPWDPRASQTVADAPNPGRPALAVVLAAMLLAAGAGAFFFLQQPVAPPEPHRPPSLPSVAHPSPLPPVPPVVQVTPEPIAPTPPPLPPRTPTDAPEAVRSVILRRQAALRQCYEVALRHQPDLHGAVMLEFDIRPDGHLADLRVSDAGQDGDGSMAAAVGPCLEKRMKSTVFPASAEVRRVHFPLQLGR